MSAGSRLQSDTPSALPAGTRLGEFELLSLLGVGGFGIVYLAFDHALEREVAVKEYMPASLAGRTETMHVSLRSQSDAETFALGLKSFVNEARLLARFDHPSLLKVLRFWEANSTAYMAMPVMRGRTVKEVRLDMRSPPDEAWLRALLEPLLGAIDKLHSEGVYHRDIAPDNIQIEPGGHPVLLDFGAARRVISDKSQTLTAILKPAYAPIEQYAEAGSVKQGPWTDIYALGATLHFLLLGRPPPPATARAVHDDASLLTTQSLPDCSQNFLHTVDWMLAPRPADRPQNVAALREVLDGRALPPQRRAPDTTASQWDRTVMLPPASARAGAAVARPADDDQATVVMPPSTLPGAPAARPQTGAARASQPLVSAQLAPAPEPAPAQAATPAATVAAAAAPRSKLLPVALGLGAIAVAAAVVLWPKAPATVATATAASAALAALPAAVPSPVATAPVALPSAPESAITTVVVPGAPPVRTGAAPTLSSTLSATPAPTPAAPVATASAAPARPVRQAQAPRAAAPAAALAQAPLQTVQPPPEPTRAVADAAAPQKPPPPAAAVEAPNPVAAGPEAKCGSRGPLSYFVCMERACLRSENVPHPDCLKWRRAARSE